MVDFVSFAFDFGHKILIRGTSGLAVLVSVFLMPAIARAQAPLAAPIENPTGRYLVWGDDKIEINQYGDLGRNWPAPDLLWEQFALLERKARANPEPPNTLRAILLVLPRVEATAVLRAGGREVVVGRRQAEMTAAEVKDAIDQWRQFENMVYVYSAGNAWLRTDVKVIDEPLAIETDENWCFWAGQQRGLLVRFDVAEPLLALLKTEGRPASESLVGWVLLEHKLAYVVLVNLAVTEAPESALGLLDWPG